jgi:calcineurin-like phosphoesterase family protein
MKYFTSDLHFNHRKILAFCPERVELLGLDKDLVFEVRELKKIWHNTKKGPDRDIAKFAFEKQNWELIQNMNERMIKIINDTVGKRDILYILGDFGFGNFNDLIKWFKRINCGRIILVKGNHDKSTKAMLQMGFDSVLENEYVKLIGPDGAGKCKILMSHFPYFPGFWERIRTTIMWKLGLWKKFDNRYPHKRPQNFGEPLLHGHTHSLQKTKGKMIHVGIDAWGKPISELEILELMNDLTGQ